MQKLTTLKINFLNHIHFRDFTSSKYLQTACHKDHITHIASQPSSRLDKYLTQKYDLTWNDCQKYLRMKQIVVQSKSEAKYIHSSSYTLKDGDILYIPKTVLQSISKTPRNQIEPTHIDIKNLKLFKSMIIEETPEYTIINKLPNISSQGGTDVTLSLPYLIRNYIAWSNKEKSLQGQNQNEEEFEVSLKAHISNRLDKNTSGVMILPKKKDFASQYSQLLKNRESVDKTYIAITDNLPINIAAKVKSNESRILTKCEASMMKGTVNIPIKYEGGSGQVTTMDNYDTEEAKECITHYECIGFVKLAKKGSENAISTDFRLNPFLQSLETVNNKCLLKIKYEDFFKEYKRGGEENESVAYHTVMRYHIVGGRKHQIRVHSSQVLKMPILLDSKYGKKRKSEDLMKRLLENGKEEHFKEMVKEKREFIEDFMGKMEYFFLHSREIRVEMQEGQNKSIHYKAEFPLHFQVYFEHVFGGNVNDVLRFM